jgi:transketolase
MRQTALDTVYRLAKLDERVVFIGSDLGAGTLKEMQMEFPNRFFMEGISEQHIVGFAAGLAKEGYIPFLNTIATFFSRRAYEQIAIDIALHKLPVRILASGGGMVYAPLGPTHTAIEDFSLMLSIPKLRVFAPADANEMKNLIEYSLADSSPWYIRFGKGGERIVTEDIQPEPWKPKIFGKLECEVLLISTGVLLQEALKVQADFPKIRITVVHIPCLNDLGLSEWETCLEHSQRVIIMEEHVPRGGLFTQILHESFLKKISNSKFIHLSLKPEFPHNYGSQGEHFFSNGLNEANIKSLISSMYE